MPCEEFVRARARARGCPSGGVIGRRGAYQGGAGSLARSGALGAPARGLFSADQYAPANAHRGRPQAQRLQLEIEALRDVMPSAEFGDTEGVGAIIAMG